MSGAYTYVHWTDHAWRVFWMAAMNPKEEHWPVFSPHNLNNILKEEMRQYEVTIP